MIQFDEHIFPDGWFNHQPVIHSAGNDHPVGFQAAESLLEPQALRELKFSYFYKGGLETFDPSDQISYQLHEASSSLLATFPKRCDSLNNFTEVKSLQVLSRNMPWRSIEIVWASSSVVWPWWPSPFCLTAMS